MNKSANIFNLMDRLLPKPELVELASPNELQRLYAGIGMPSLREAELKQALGCMDYYDAKAANPLLILIDSNGILNRYAELREQALEGDPDALNDLGWWWMNGSRLKANYPLARRLFKLAANIGSPEALFNLAEMTCPQF